MYVPLIKGGKVRSTRNRKRGRKADLTVFSGGQELHEVVQNSVDPEALEVCPAVFWFGLSSIYFCYK